MTSPGGDEQRDADTNGTHDGALTEQGTERLLAEEVDENLTELLFQDPPPPQTYPAS